MTTQSTQTPPAGFWKVRHLIIALGAVALIVMLMLRGCGSDESEEKAAKHEENMPRQAIVVQIPASQWPQQQPPVQPPAPQQPGYGYVPQQPGYGYAPQTPAYGYAPQQQQPVQPQAPVMDGSNPWAVQTPQGYNYGQQDSAQWGRPQPRAPQYVPPSSGVSRYRPLDEDDGNRPAPRPAPQPPVQSYRPAAPYDRLSGSSFGEGAQMYPYGAYPGYGAGAYGVPVTPYAPVYPGVVPGAGWPGMW